MEETMKTIKTTITDWGFPAVLLMSWMMATAYTISII
jgi:hypothetical protein